jgi:glycosyltransferase involved in cell wall biosynthesis
MRILQLVKYYDPSQGGMETVVKNIVDGVIENSVDLSFTVYSNNHKRSVLKSVELKNRIKIVKEITPAHLVSQPLNLIYLSLRTLIQGNDVIHHHYPFPTMELALVRCFKQLSGKKFVITWHANINNSRWSWTEGFYNLLMEKLLIRADAIVVTSPQLLEESKILVKYREKVRVVPLCYDPKYSSHNARKFPQERCFELLFVGKLRKYKGVEYLLRAIINLDVRLKVVGNGEELLRLITLVESLKIERKVTFILSADDNELLNYYKESDLFVLPSINEAEAFGVVQLEALANGLPVINTNLRSGVPFVSLSEYSGITVEPKNSDALRVAIERIIQSEELYEFFSRNSLERVKLFSREKLSESYMKIYQTP